MRNSQKFVPPLRTNTRRVPQDGDSRRAPTCRRLYSDPAVSIFSSTPVLIAQPSKKRSPMRPGVTPDSHEEAKSSVLRRQNKKLKAMTSPAVSSVRSVPDQTSSPGTTEGYQTDINHQRANVANKGYRQMTSESLPAVRDHLTQPTPYDCASIFNFTPSPPPKRKAVSVSEKRKVHSFPTLVSVISSNCPCKNVMISLCVSLGLPRSSTDHLQDEDTTSGYTGAPQTPGR